MIGKLKKGSSFGGCIRYVTGKDEAKIIASDGVLLGTNAEMTQSFELQRQLNPRINNPASPWKSARPEATSASGAGCTAPLWAPTRITPPSAPAAPPWCGNSPSSDHPKTAVKKVPAIGRDLFPCRFNSPGHVPFSASGYPLPQRAAGYIPLQSGRRSGACTAGPALPASGLC